MINPKSIEAFCLAVLLVSGVLSQEIHRPTVNPIITSSSIGSSPQKSETSTSVDPTDPSTASISTDMLTSTSAPPTTEVSSNTTPPTTSVISTTFKSSSSPSTTGPTPKPELSKEELLQQTDHVLTNITKSIDVFLTALAVVTPAPTESTISPGPKEARKINLPSAIFLGQKLEQAHQKIPVATISSICNVTDSRCLEFIAPLITIQGKLTKLTTQIDMWKEFDLLQLRVFSSELAYQVENKTADVDFMTNVVNEDAAENVLGDFITEIQDASNAIQDVLSNDKNSVIFVAVFCSIGGLIVLSLIIGVTATCVKSKKVKKGNKSKNYSKVPEERVPVQGFLSGHSNDAFDGEDYRKPKNESYAMSKQPAPSNPMRDPYSRPTGDTKHIDPHSTSSISVANDPYTRPKSPDHYYAKPGTSRQDDYYVRDGSTRGHLPREGGRGSMMDDPYAKPSKGPNQGGGLKRYHY